MGGSPCTHWSIAQTNNRETEPSGIGWELFENYVIGLKKYKPEYFLYENNKSMSPAIKAQITNELGVEPILINSALVSAQNRQRLYWTNIPGVTQPEDRAILLKDILETGIAWREKSYTLDANYYKTAGTYNPKSQHSYSRHMVAEPIRIGTIENDNGSVNTVCQSSRVYSSDGKSVTLRAQGGGGGAKTGLYAVPVKVEWFDGKTYPIYEVRNEQITIKGIQYPIRLLNGYYIIRKLTVQECMRLQTVPEWYVFPVSNTQAYKMLGNGWTVEVIAHIL